MHKTMVTDVAGFGCAHYIVGAIGSSALAANDVLARTNRMAA